MKMLLKKTDEQLIYRINNEKYLSHRNRGDVNYFAWITIPSFLGEYLIKQVPSSPVTKTQMTLTTNRDVKN